MKIILGILALILAIGFIGFLMPAIIGIVIGIFMISEGSVREFGGASEYGEPSEPDVFDEECPFCGSGDTDGNHCYTCGRDF